MKTCPCGTGLEYGECCEQYIAGHKPPPTAQALMRSRYSAYVESAISYIVETCTHDEKNKIDVKETKNWSEKSKWLGLKILSAEKGGEGDEEGTVEFHALYEMDGFKDNHHEIAKFKRINGRWFYHEGVIVPKTVTRSGPKIGRNDPCPCGSGKKYKKCCG